MALIEIKADLGRVANALEKIAEYLRQIVLMQANPAAKQVVYSHAALDHSDYAILDFLGRGQPPREKLEPITDERLADLEEERERAASAQSKEGVKLEEE